MSKVLSAVSVFLFFAAGWAITGWMTPELAAQETLVLPQSQDCEMVVCPVTEVAANPDESSSTESAVEASAAPVIELPAESTAETAATGVLIVNFFLYDASKGDLSVITNDDAQIDNYDYDYFVRHYTQATHIIGTLQQNGETLFTFDSGESSSVQFDNISEMEVEIFAEKEGADENSGWFGSKRFEIQFNEDGVMEINFLLFYQGAVPVTPTNQTYYPSMASSGGNGWWGLAGLAGLAGLIKCSPNSPK